jgi:hypothetical protein
VCDTPANARRTGNPSPSNPTGAVVTDCTGRCVPVAVLGTGTRGKVSVSAVMAGMHVPLSRQEGVGITRCDESGVPATSPTDVFETSACGVAGRARACGRSQQRIETGLGHGGILLWLGAADIEGTNSCVNGLADFEQDTE